MGETPQDAILIFLAAVSIAVPLFGSGILFYFLNPYHILARSWLFGSAAFASLAFSASFILAVRPSISWEGVGWWMLAAVPMSGVGMLMLWAVATVLAPYAGRHIPQPSSKTLNATGGQPEQSVGG